MKGIYPGLWLCLTGIIISSANAQVPSIDYSHSLRDKHGCLLYNPDPEPHPKPVESIRWSGSCKDGHGDGPGKLEWFDKNGVSDGWIKGTFVRGTLQGFGEAQDFKGGHYHGQYLDSLPHGRGTYVFASGTRYDGEFRDGLAEGHGTLVWTNGTRFEGEFKASKRNGHGTIIETSGYRLEGEFKDDRVNGHVIVTRPDGAKTEGEFCDKSGTAKAQIFCSTASASP